MDNHTPEQRRRIMQAVRSKNTEPELIVRKALHRLGYRYRLHRQDLPGSPDIVFPGRKKVIFVHGCFWHGHDCPRGKAPNSNVDFWKDKIEKNKKRDLQAQQKLGDLGWESLLIWSCEIKNSDPAIVKIKEFLDK